jgi:hypothetical protein
MWSAQLLGVHSYWVSVQLLPRSLPTRSAQKDTHAASAASHVAQTLSSKGRHVFTTHRVHAWLGGLQVYLITELLTGGELLDAVLQRGSYNEAEARMCFVQLLRGIEYLHSKWVQGQEGGGAAEGTRGGDGRAAGCSAEGECEGRSPPCLWLMDQQLCR